MSAQTQKPKVLVIDDDPSLRSFSQVVFERAGFDVSTAKEGTEGIRLALINIPQVIILDLLMEGLHGFEICKILRANEMLRRTAIIIASGKSYKPDVDKAMELGADAYIIKPYSSKELIEIATEYMNKRASQP